MCVCVCGPCVCVCVCVYVIIYSVSVDPWVATIPSRLCKDEADWLMRSERRGVLLMILSHPVYIDISLPSSLITQYWPVLFAELGSIVIAQQWHASQNSIT